MKKAIEPVTQSWILKHSLKYGDILIFFIISIHYSVLEMIVTVFSYHGINFQALPFSHQSLEH
jgi:hypothetical protein